MSLHIHNINEISDETKNIIFDINEPVEGLVLKGVTGLTFGYSFNQRVEKLDLKGVTSLTFGWGFNQPVDGLELEGVAIVLPASYHLVKWRPYNCLAVYDEDIYNESCLICQDANSREQVVTGCGHLYCYRCLKTWYRIRRTCCYCRKDLNPNNITKPA